MTGPTHFIEANAFLLATENDSVELAEYLDENFSDRELEKLRDSCNHLEHMTDLVIAMRSRQDKQ